MELRPHIVIKLTGMVIIRRYGDKAMKKLTVNVDEATYRLLRGKLGYQGLSFQKWAEQQIKTFVQKPMKIAKGDFPIEYINQID